MENNSEAQLLNTSGGFMNKFMLIVLILAIILNVVGSGCVEYMLLMFRSLQIVVHLTILQVVFPANALVFFQYIVSIVWFDIQDGFSFFNFLTFIKYDYNVQPKVISQMNDIGYNNRNAFSALKTLTFVLFLYFSRVFLSLCTGLFIYCIGLNNKKLKQLHQFLIKGIFFNQIIRISMEAYFEFFLIGYMNY